MYNRFRGYGSRFRTAYRSGYRRFSSWRPRFNYRRYATKKNSMYVGVGVLVLLAILAWWKWDTIKIWIATKTK